MLGPGLTFDTSKYFVVSSNILGSCYGSTSALSMDPDTGEAYGETFPKVRGNSKEIFSTKHAVSRLAPFDGSAGGVGNLS